MTNDNATGQTSADVWEERYGDAPVWSGNPNAALVANTAGLTPGRALDLGCGEGADAIWLAEHGWQVTGIDVSATALTRACARASARRVEVEWVQADLAAWEPSESYDLVTSFFLHSRVRFPRARILANAAAAVAPGGVLLIVGHAEFPPWATHHKDHDHGAPTFPTIAETIAEAGLEAGWDLLVAGTEPREVRGPEGQRATIRDTVLKARRRDEPGE